MMKNILFILMALSLYNTAHALRWGAPQQRPAAPGGLDTNQDTRRYDVNPLKREAYLKTRLVVIRKTLKDLEDARDTASTHFKDLEELHKKLLQEFPLGTRTSSQMTILKDTFNALQRAERDYRAKNAEYLREKENLLA
jgi:hypothetical protein